MPRNPWSWDGGRDGRKAVCLHEHRQVVQRWVMRWARTVVLRPEESPGTGSNRGQGLGLKEDRGSSLAISGLSGFKTAREHSTA